MNNSQKTLALVISGAFALSIALNSMAAVQNPFATKVLSSGYQVADAESKMKKASKNSEAVKVKEGSCSAEKMKDGGCSAQMKIQAK